MTLIKVCGVTTAEDAAMLASSGVDWIGLNFWTESKRVVDRRRARVMATAARRVNPTIKIVGVFVNHSAKEIELAVEAAALDYVQLHGDESPVFAKRFDKRCIKAIALQDDKALEDLERYDCPWTLVDTPCPGRGGSGETGDWPLAARAVSLGGQIWLAGGLTPANVAAAIAAVKPYGVDVASGVELSPGIKDVAKVEAFVQAVRSCS